ncbi:hypothetical protein DMB66_53705 [Actinoplanes sp. ATCC 53533]|uniref:hypothetical protein n=1 Tax=Actinoplanes sp. ATCC 53533 TaxID=1288362 RepID=UPI000F7B3A32|nr:hypothetical protein [Actinoplanes sp. ATCC 53533]RSM43108.1 hypothetical protein DMB66_53705 [Actinoplanes sp. ATCC 53533]
MHIAADGTWLATTGTTGYSGGDPVVRIWDPTTGIQLHQLGTGHPRGVERTHIAADSSYLVAIGPTSVVFWLALLRWRIGGSRQA